MCSVGGVSTTVGTNRGGSSLRKLCNFRAPYSDCAGVLLLGQIIGGCVLSVLIEGGYTLRAWTISLLRADHIRCLYYRHFGHC